MSIQQSVQPAFEITAKVLYVPAESKPESNYYFFAYKILIKNTGSDPAQLMSRHWKITNSTGHVEEVRGPGVVGQQPKIQEGQSFEYESACPLPTPSGTMKGTFDFVDENGSKFTVEVPEFYLIAPHALH